MSITFSAWSILPSTKHPFPALPQEYIDIFVVSAVVIVFLFLFLLLRRLHVLKNMRDLQDKLLKHHVSYARLINNMPIIYFQIAVLHDDQGKPTDVIYQDTNNRFVEFAKRKDIIGKKGSEIFPESMPTMLEYIHLAEKSKDRSIAFPFYYEMMNAHFNIIISPTHCPSVWDVFCMDSTQLSTTEEKLSFTSRMLETAIEVANIVPWQWNLETHIIQYEMADPFGLKPVRKKQDKEFIEITDKEYFSRIHPEDHRKIWESIDRLVEGKTNKIKAEYRIIYYDQQGQRQEWIELQAIVDKYDDNHKVQSLVGSALVITAHKQLEEELLQAKYRAEASNRLKSAFLANLSHEIRTPLNAIAGFSDLLIDEKDITTQQQYVEIIKTNTDLLLQLIGDILDLSKIEAGTLEFVYSDFELNSLFYELESIMHLRLKGKPILLHSEVPASPCMIHSEKTRLSQVLMNLLTNAIKFTDKGSISFGYCLEDKMIRFHVYDTGCGIPSKEHEHIFERFVKLNAFEQGTGLGLSICRMIINHLGGQIGVESEEGKGAKFWFTVPREKVDEPPYNS